MASDLPSEVRIQETKAAVSELDSRVNAWLDVQERLDARNHYKTLRTALRIQLLALLCEASKAMDGLTASSGRGYVYAQCRIHENRLLWIERLWNYFREKVDQRQSEPFKRTLQAADEVIWSCYAPPFRAIDAHHKTVPLAFIASEYSPKALARGTVPQELRNRVDTDFLRKMLMELPVPLVELPRRCIDEPWWLTYAAHEIGHQIQHDIEDSGTLISRFREVIRQSIEDEDTRDRWAYRGEEIFADMYSLYMLGPWALWALTELEWTTDEGMMNDKNRYYPSPLMRLHLMKQVLTTMGIDGKNAMRGFADVLPSPSDQALIAGVAKAASEAEVVGTLSLANLCQWKNESRDASELVIDEFHNTFVGRGDRGPDISVLGPRRALAGGLAAWAEISTIVDQERRTAEKKALKDAVLEMLPLCAEPVERGDADEAMPNAARVASTTLNDVLFKCDPNTMEPY